MVACGIDTYTKAAGWRVSIPDEMREAADENRRRLVARVYAETGPRLYRYALMILADRGDAEDVLQQVFAAALSSRTLDVDDDAAYFRTAVRNAAFSLLRRRRTVRAADELLIEPVSAECSPAEQAALNQALRRLPPEQREVIHLHVYEGMTFREVAGATGESINTISARYRYALDRLRMWLA